MINFNSFYFSIIHVFNIESFQANVSQNAHVFNVYSNGILKRFQHSLFVLYRDLQARVHEQETRNLTLHSAAPRAMLNFLFLVRELVLVNPDNAHQECCNP